MAQATLHHAWFAIISLTHEDRQTEKRKEGVPMGGVKPSTNVRIFLGISLKKGRKTALACLREGEKALDIPETLRNIPSQPRLHHFSSFFPPFQKVSLR